MSDNNLESQLIQAQETIRALQHELEETNRGLVALTLEVERKSEEVRAAAAKYHALFDSASDAIFIHDLAGHFLEVNRVACERLGYSREELLKMTPGDIDAPEYTARFAREGPRLLEELQQRGRLIMETAHVRRDGTVIPTELSTRLIEFGGARAVLSMARDITERKQADEALRESERKLRLIAENTTDVIFAYDMERRLIYVNPAVHELTGYTVAELRERDYINWLYSEDEAGMAAMWEDLFAGKGFSGEEFRIVTKDGQIKWCLSSWGPLYDESGRQIGVQGRERDITERKRADEQLRQRYEQTQAIYRLTDAVNQATALEDIYKEALDSLQRILTVKRSAILLFDAQGIPRFTAWRGLSENYRRAVAGHSPWSPDAKNPQPVLVPDVEEEPTLEHLRSAILGEGIHALAFIPLVHQGRLIGKFMIYYDAPHSFGAEEIQLAQAITDHVALAIGRAQAEKATRDSRDAVLNMLDDLSEAATRDQARVKELEFLTERLSIATEESDRLATQLAAINRLDHIISSSLDLNEIYRAFAAESEKIISFDRVSVALVEGDQVRVFATEIGVKTTVGAEAVLSLKGGTVEAVIESGQPLIRHDLIAEERYPEDRELIAAGMRSGVLVPLAAKGRMLGTFDVASCQVNAYAEKDLPLLQSLADQLAIAIENAGLHRKVLASEQEYRTLVENATELIWALDTEGCFTFVNRQAEEASGHKLQDWLGKSFAPLIAPPEDLPRIQQIFLDTLSGKGQGHDVGVYRSDGSVLRLSVNTAPLYRDGEVVGTISFGRDATAEKEAEAALLQRMAELSALFDVSGALRGVEGVEHMLPIIVDKAVEVCRADCGSVSLVDESRETLITRYGTGARQNLVGARLRLGQGISGQVAQSGVPHVSPDFQRDPLLAFDPGTPTHLPEIASDICVPLRVGEQVVGAMHVSSYTPRTFAEAEVRLFTAIADMAATAIRRVSLFEQLEHRVRELSALFDVGKMVTATLHIEDVLKFVVGAATEAEHAEGCYLFMWDEREERLVMRAARGLAQGLVERVKYRLGEGLSGWVFLEGRTANVPDVAADLRWKREPDYEATHPSGLVVSALVSPLVVGGKTLGVLGVVNKIGAAAFSQSDESLLTALAGQVAVAIENARLYEDVRGLSIAAIRSLATAIDARDPYTRGHSEGVTHLAVQVARELGWSGADLEMLEFAALLHDVGKIAVPDAVLRKVEPLTADEWNIIRLHPYHSAQIIKPVEPLQRIVPWVYHHQERWDGSGYPDGLKGEAIPLASRIIGVVDAFNAMTTDRPYRKALSVTAAQAEIERGAGKQFDPAVAEVFLRLINRE